MFGQHTVTVILRLQALLPDLSFPEEARHVARWLDSALESINLVDCTAFSTWTRSMFGGLNRLQD